MNIEIEVKLQNIFKSIFDSDLDFKSELSSRTLSNWDSLNFLSIILSIEEEFGVVFETNDLLVMDSYSGILYLLRDKLNLK